MGFSLYLYKINGDRLVDPDREGVQKFLRRRRMHMKVFPPSSADRSSSATLLNDTTQVTITYKELPQLQEHLNANYEYYAS